MPASLHDQLQNNQTGSDSNLSQLQSTPKGQTVFAVTTTSEKVPRHTKAQVPKRAQVDCLAPEDAVNQGEGGSRAVQRKRSRNWEFSRLSQIFRTNRPILRNWLRPQYELLKVTSEQARESMQSNLEITTKGFGGKTRLGS